MAWEDVTGENPNLTRFLDFLGKSEGADWNTVVGGKKFSDFSQHPNVVGLTTPDGPSTAAGKYQITGTTYRDVAPKIGVNDFSPESQNQVAIELMRRNGALDDVLAGNYEPAIKKLGGVWASLPSSNYNQPKRDWNFVKANLTNSSADEGWETVSPAAKSDAGWETVTPASPNEPARGRPTMQNDPRIVDPNQPAPTNAPQRAALDNLKRNLELGTRDVLVGAEKAATFPVRAGADFAAGVLGLAGGGNTDVYKYLTGLGLKGKGVGDMASDAANLATPETSREKLVSAGVQAAAGLPIGSVVNKIAEKSPQAVQGVLSVLMPGTGGTAGQVAKDAALTGAVGAGFEAAPAETLGVLALAGAGKAAIGAANQSRKVESFVRNSGDESRAATDAEILRRAKTVFEDTNRMTGKGAPVVSAAELNGKVTESFLREGKDLVAALPKDFAGKKELTSALSMGRRLEPDAIEALRTSKAGNAVADIIQAAQRADKVTAALPARGGILGTAARTVIDAVPATISATTGIPVVVGSSITEGIKQKLGGRVSREGVIQKLLDKQAGIVDDVTARTGPAAAVNAKGILTSVVDKATQAKQAQIELAKKAADAKLAQDATTKLQVLKDTRRPLSGAFQELLPGGASNLNLSSKEAIDALRLVSRQQKDGPIGNAAMEILRSGNVGNKDAFYGLQNQLRKLQEQGVLGGQPGALTSATSGIRNPVSYAEAVRTAGEAANIARASAPTKELAQFATKVAGTKAPEAKAKMIAERLAQSTDPAEKAFLSKFVEPLAQFGKK